jgi:two-component system phosphate regulon response regulator PhoB
MAEPFILVVEDETAISEMLRFSLQGAGFAVAEAGDAAQAQTVLYERLPALILLDWMLPGMSGLELARRIKKETLTREIPIIMLTARGEEADKVRGLECGADDYITKPFSPRELIARIRAVLRRAAGHAGGEALSLDGLTLYPTEHRVTVQDHELHIGPTEFRLLHFFMARPDRVYSRAQVLDHVWGSNTYIEERTVDVHIRRLRKVLAEHQREYLVQTVRGVGYRFSARA